MKDPQDVVAVVHDHGLFIELALRLARTYKKVYITTPSERGFPTLDDCSPGDGFDTIERCEDVWSVKDKVDLAIFPDIQGASTQLELVRQGIPVWGSRNADRLELHREFFVGTLKKLGLEVPTFHTCHGLKELRHYLEDKSDKYIKISRFRGSTETRHWIDEDLSYGILDEFAITFGAMQNHVPFLVFDPIPAEVEWGYDGYFCGGKFPRLSIQGPEIKDRCYIGAVTDYDDLPEMVREVNEAFAPVLAQYGMCNNWSTEIRKENEKRSVFIDPTPRFPSPAGEGMMEIFDNVPDYIWAGANGECIDPVPVKVGGKPAEFVVECLLEHHDPSERWRVLRIPEETRKWFKIYNVCGIDDLLGIPPQAHMGDTCGAVLGVGTTIEKAVDHLKDNLESVENPNFHAHLDALMDAVREIHEAAEQDVVMTDKPVPEPAELVDD